MGLPWMPAKIGLHSSISIHICDEYFDQNTGQWVREKMKWTTMPVLTSALLETKSRLLCQQDWITPRAIAKHLFHVCCGRTRSTKAGRIYESIQLLYGG